VRCLRCVSPKPIRRAQVSPQRHLELQSRSPVSWTVIAVGAATLSSLPTSKRLCPAVSERRRRSYMYSCRPRTDHIAAPHGPSTAAITVNDSSGNSKRRRNQDFCDDLCWAAGPTLRHVNSRAPADYTDGAILPRGRRGGTSPTFRRFLGWSWQSGRTSVIQCRHRR